MKFDEVTQKELYKDYPLNKMNDDYPLIASIALSKIFKLVSLFVRDRSRADILRATKKERTNSISIICATIYSDLSIFCLDWDYSRFIATHSISKRVEKNL